MKIEKCDPLSVVEGNSGVFEFMELYFFIKESGERYRISVGTENYISKIKLENSKTPNVEAQLSEKILPLPDDKLRSVDQICSELASVPEELLLDYLESAPEL